MIRGALLGVLLVGAFAANSTCWNNAGTPPGVSDEKTCAWRQLAWEYGKSLLPERGDFATLFDALQLQCCGLERPTKTDAWVPPTLPTPTTGTLVFADALHGNDSNPGSESHPVQSVARAVAVARMRSAPTATVLLREGVYEMLETVVLSDKDSGLTIQNYEGEHAVLSGGKSFSVPLSAWKPVNQSSGWDVINGMNNVYGIAQPNQNVSDTVYIGSFETVDECKDGVEKSGLGAPSFTWHSPQFSGNYSRQCFAITSLRWGPVPEAEIYSGLFVDRNVWGARVAVGGQVFGLRVDGKSATNAKFPNLPLELSGSHYISQNAVMGTGEYDAGWVTLQSNSQWTPPPKGIVAREVIVNATHWPSVEWPMTEAGGSKWTGEGAWGDFHIGIDGYCKGRYSPPTGYWCANSPPRGNCWGCGAVQTAMSPLGLTPPSGLLPHFPYNTTNGAMITAWRGGGRWYTNTFLIDEVDPDSGEFIFSTEVGGNQGGEGEIVGSQWFVEGVLEELDFPGEYVYDGTTLFYQFNSSTKPTGNEAWVATQNDVLFNITGTASQPVRNIAILGVEIRDTRHQLLDVHGMPSGGDWALVAKGAVTLRGVENVTISQSFFEQVDGNGVFLGGYCRDVSISRNEFAWIGATAIAAWGDGSTCLSEDCSISSPYPVGPDLRGGNQPRGTRILSNYVREIGLRQKQSSAYFQAIASVQLIGNVFINGPRAGVNFNDGGVGGDVVSRNVLANQVRESGDHAAFNSWSRLPFIINASSDGHPTILPPRRTISQNLALGVYSTQSCWDTDDGSCLYDFHNNVFPMGSWGLKSDFGGRLLTAENNLWTDVSQCFVGMSADGSGTGSGNMFSNNSCHLLDDTGSYGSDCNLAANATVSHNAIYNPSGAIKVCGGIPLQQWVSQGHDPGSTISSTPPISETIAFAKTLLGLA